MRLFLVTAFLLVNSFCFSQRHNVYFLKNNGQYLNTRDSADYIRIVAEPDSGSTLYNVGEYYMDGKQKLLGKTSSIIPLRLEGTCVEFYKNGKKQTVSDYKGGNVLGLIYYYYPNGKLYEVMHCATADTRGIFGDSKIISENDSTGTVLVSDSNGYYKGFDNGFKKIVEEGPIKNGNKDGKWKGNEEGLGIIYTEEYVDGKLISGVSIDKNGDSVKYYGSRTTQPKFKNDAKEFSTFLSNNVRYPDIDRARGIQGKVILTFVVEKDGQLTDIKVIRSVSPTLDEEAVRVLKESKRWVPGYMFGRPVRVQYSVPFSFALSN